jgi:murein DD-endopeptidase MepM/ murein hydrolase activator NlpD
MAPQRQARVGILPPADKAAIVRAAQQLQLDPYELGAFLSLESGPNMDPNVWGGLNDDYYGLIQFGRNERSKYLDPRLIGTYTRAEQIPKAVQFLLDRGFKPGKMGVGQAYATVLLGNPYEPLTNKDSWGTSPANSLRRFKPGGDLYANAKRVLGDIAAPTQPSGPRFERPSQVDIPTGQQPGQPASATVNRPPQDIFQNLMQGVQKIFGTTGPRRSSSEDYLDKAMALDSAGQSDEAMKYYEAAFASDATPSKSDDLEETFSSVLQPAVTSYLDVMNQRSATGPTTTAAPAPAPGTPTPAGPMGSIRAGRIAHPHEDVFPTTGPHLHVRVLRNNEDVNPEYTRSILQNLYAGGKPLYALQGSEWRPSYPITSRFGPRTAPTAGASTYHRGVDYGIPAETPLEWRGRGTYRPERGFGVIETTDPQGQPYTIRLAHTVPG